MNMRTGFIKQNTSNRQGFTLTEVLLAVMIVGLIGVALAALSRAAARESGVGRSKIMLRNNISSFVRNLRKDLSSASFVSQVAGPLSNSDLNSSNNNRVALMQVAKNVDRTGKLLLPQGVPSGTSTAPTDTVARQFTTYCFQRGANTNNIVPSSAYRGGTIYKVVHSDSDLTSTTMPFPECGSPTAANTTILLQNVKYIPSNDGLNYPVPLFNNLYDSDYPNGLMEVRIITELDSAPIVNEVIEERFAVPLQLN